MGMNAKQFKLTSNACLFLGFASILGSIAIWYLAGGTGAESKAHAERFGIFVGLWAPTFFILSNRFDRYAEKAGAGAQVPARDRAQEGLAPAISTN